MQIEDYSSNLTQQSNLRNKEDLTSQGGGRNGLEGVGGAGLNRYMEFFQFCEIFQVYFFNLKIFTCGFKCYL